QERTRSPLTRAGEARQLQRPTSNPPHLRPHGHRALPPLPPRLPRRRLSTSAPNPPSLHMPQPLARGPLLLVGQMVLAPLHGLGVPVAEPALLRHPRRLRSNRPPGRVALVGRMRHQPLALEVEPPHQIPPKYRCRGHRSFWTTSLSCAHSASTSACSGGSGRSSASSSSSLMSSGSGANVRNHASVTLRFASCHASAVRCSQR